MSFERADVPRNGMRPETLRERLLRQREFDTTECWNWTGQRTQSGYGVTSWNGKHVRAHRASYAVFIGTIEPGMLVCHRCDNPLCINPDHLFIGSPADNVRDMKDKGRGKHANGLAAARLKSPKGEQHWRAVLTETDVLQLRELKRQGATIRELSQRFNVSKFAAQAASVGTTWSHLPGAVPKLYVRPHKRITDIQAQINKLQAIEMAPALHTEEA